MITKYHYGEHKKQSWKHLRKKKKVKTFKRSVKYPKEFPTSHEKIIVIFRTLRTPSLKPFKAILERLFPTIKKVKDSHHLKP